MRSVLTALAFLVILLAVIPAVKRSLYPLRNHRESVWHRAQGKRQRPDQA